MARGTDGNRSSEDARLSSAVSGPELSFLRILIAVLVCSTVIVSVLLATAGAQENPPTAPTTRFEGYPGAPTFSVVSRKDTMFFYPCGQCHAAMEPNPEIRPLSVMHVSEIEHGRGRIWCLSCHYVEDRDYLRTLLGEPVDFDETATVCGGCHASRHKDWVFGIHGKRVGTWQGERLQYGCTQCHDPHKPAIQPRAPKPPPPVRRGLQLEPGVEHEKTVPWLRQEERQQ